MSARVLDRKSRAALMLARGWPTERVATEVGVTSRTIRRWAKEEEFDDQVQEIRRTSMAETLRGLESVARSAVAALGAALHQDQPMGIRVRAALGVLATLPAIAAHVELEERIGLLEAGSRCLSELDLPADDDEVSAP
ncbi:helix-turn-helix domain-containing protein [Streptomyces sp. CAI-85]|uniref:helix-turn-helix domain-containing protein n=1 Tax=Streptomyces sp. CAI-85 TaxID=1472662 RepID=UPI001587E6D4|nr:helix-turn-helix domain-containing protein [Streptomyces sp. CAI-85]NUV64993.1 helix-turn-helix domain-containing protein [Streptomyces sp. CAI-85]